ncbi:hypothetical protein N9N54_07600 [Planktomarina temperata]|nr:hypothetical protein [Planktomarina temperata]
MKVKPKFLCPTCRHYESEAYHKECKDCLNKPADFKKSYHPSGARSDFPENVQKTQTVEASPKRFSFDFLTIMLALCLFFGSVHAYRESGEDGVIKAIIIFCAIIGSLYIVGRMFGSNRPDKSFSDILTSGIMRLFLVMLLMSIPFGILNMIGIIDMSHSRGCHPNSYNCEEEYIPKY